MGLLISIPKETEKFEKRVAATPETVKKLSALGCKIIIQSDAGKEAKFLDDAYTKSGATIAKTTADTLKNADIVLSVQIPDISTMKKGALLITLMDPHNNEAVIAACAKAGVTACSMELVPRITRAQSMDVLSSQSNLAGYKSILDAAEYFSRAFPMMMTAAGTVPPAKVFVMGAGVAGLQAIATARRLGGVVSATDVRPAAKEQVESLGANFIAVEDDEFKQAETAGGYAKEMSKAYQKKQTELVLEHIAKQDIVITTALIPGRPAPKLITEAMVKSMAAGSVIVDLAAQTGGNCALTESGKVIEKHDITIIGHANVPSRLATNASALYAKNLLNFLTLLIDEKSGTLNINLEDEIVKGVTITIGGEIIHPDFIKTKSAPATKTTTKKKVATKKTAPKKSAAKKKITKIKTVKKS